MPPKSAATAPLNALKTLLDRLSGGKKGAKGKRGATPGQKKKEDDELSEAFDKITEVWSTDVLSKKNDVHKILEGLRKHVDASAAQVTPLPEHVNRALGDLLDRVNMALPNGRQTDILEANEIVEQVLALIEHMLDTGYLDKEACGRDSFQKLFRIVLNGGRYRIKSKRTALELISTALSKCPPNQEFLAGPQATSFLRKSVHRLHETGDYFLQQQFFEIISNIAKKLSDSAKEEFLGNVFDEELDAMEKFVAAGRGSAAIRKFLLGFNDRTDGLVKFPKCLEVDKIVYNKIAILPEDAEALHVAFNQDSISFEGIAEGDAENGSLQIIMGYGQITGWSLEKVGDNETHLVVVFQTKAGKTATNHTVEINAAGLRAGAFGQLAFASLNKRKGAECTDRAAAKEFGAVEANQQRESRSEVVIDVQANKNPGSRKRSVSSMRIFVSSPARRHDSIEDDSAAPAWLDDIDMGDAKVEEARQDMQVDRDPYDPPEDTMRSPVKKNYSARKPGTKDSDVVLAVDSHPSEPDHAPVSALRGGAKKQAPVSDDEKSKEEPPKRKRAAAGRKKKVVDSESEPEAESEDEYQPTQVKKAAAKKEEEVKKPAAKQPRGRGKAAAKKPVVDHGSEDDDQEVPEEPVNKTRKRSAPTPPREQPPAKRPASTRKTLPAIEEDEDEMPEGGLVASLRKARMEKESAVKRVAGDDQAPQPAPKPAQPVLPVQSKKPAKRVSSIEDFAGLFGDLDDKAIPSAQPKSNWVLHKPKSDRGENSEISEQVVMDDQLISPTLESRKGNQSAQIVAAAMVELDQKGAALQVKSALELGTSKNLRLILESIRKMNSDEEEPIRGRIEELPEEEQSVEQDDVEMHDQESESPADDWDSNRPAVGGTQPLADRRHLSRVLFADDDEEDEEEDGEHPGDITLINNLNNAMSRFGNIADDESLIAEGEPMQVDRGTDSDLDENMVRLFKRLGEIVAGRMAARHSANQASLDAIFAKMDKKVEKMLSNSLVARVNLIKGYLAESERRSKELAAALLLVKQTPRKDLDDALDAAIAAGKSKPDNHARGNSNRQPRMKKLSEISFT